jgi:F-type H+-transporting ATPase subunit c
MVAESMIRKEIGAVNKLFQVAVLVILPLVLSTQVLGAEEEGEAEAVAAARQAVQDAQEILGREGFSIYFGAAFAAGLVIVGAGYGISRIGSAAVESMARQPEVAGNIQTAMIIAAALIEGATFFALIVCIAAL